jgi:RNA polymerase sigma-70 factor (ECF subfamily)
LTREGVGFHAPQIGTQQENRQEAEMEMKDGAARSQRNGTPRQADRFEDVILPHADWLYGPALALTRSATDAEDLVQDTMLRAYTRFDTFRLDGSAKAWLHTIMRNLFINGYRKKNREPLQVPLDGLVEDTRAGGGVERGSDAGAAALGAHRLTAASPERLVLAKMEGDAALRAVAALPPDYREVLVLSDIHGMSYQQVADRLGIPIGTVRSRLSRGRRRVQRALLSWRPSVAPHAVSPALRGVRGAAARPLSLPA